MTMPKTEGLTSFPYTYLNCLTHILQGNKKNKGGAVAQLKEDTLQTDVKYWICLGAYWGLGGKRAAGRPIPRKLEL